MILPVSASLHSLRSVDGEHPADYLATNLSRASPNVPTMLAMGPKTEGSGDAPQSDPIVT
jgi:hypothetical protein